MIKIPRSPCPNFILEAGPMYIIFFHVPGPMACPKDIFPT